MLAGRDSAYAPNDAQLAAFYAQGVRVFGGYIKLGNDGIYHGWSQADFARVKARGMVPIAYMSGWDDPAQARAVANSWGVAIVLVDIESGIRPDGTWVQGWLNAAQAGEYGNAAVHYNRSAPVHEDAGYFGYDPRATWPANVPRPVGVCGWQFQGSHNENGLTVDSAWWDDSIATSTYGAVTAQLQGDSLDLTNPVDAQVVKNLAWCVATLSQIYYGKNPDGSDGAPPWLEARLTQLESDIKANPTPAPIDASALVAALMPALTPAIASAVTAVLAGTVADITAIRMRVEKDLAS